MKRVLSVILVCALVAGLARAKKGNGNGGGGGGGGENLTGLLYVFLETPIESALAYGLADPVAFFALNPDGSVEQQLTQTGEWKIFGEASYEFHDNARVFLHQRTVGGSNPDGTPRNVLAATLEDGTVVHLTNGGEDIRILGGARPAVRWGKDDSFVSFAAIVWDANGDPSTHVFEAPVSWNGSGVPSLSAAPTGVVDGTVTVQSGQSDASSLGGHDWSADATQLVYKDGDLIKVVTFGSGTATIATAYDTAFGDPRWSPTSDRIAYVDDSEIYLVDSDGANKALIASGGSQSTLYPRWSPDGDYIAYLRYKDIKIKGKSNYTNDLYIAVASGNSSPVNVTSATSDRVGWFQGWR